MMQGTKVVSISKTSMASTCLTVPSIEEQVTISEILSSIDSLIVLHQRKYERLQHLKQALLQKMFPKPGELVPELRFDGFTEPWEERKLGEIGEVKPEIPHLRQMKLLFKKGTPWITPTDIRENGTYSVNKHLSTEGMSVAQLAPAGSILCTCIASIGKNTFTETTCGFNQQINALIPAHDTFDSYFLFSKAHYGPCK
ncbi:restriction endonuclease subunit S [Bifidobacterium canis]|uniref:restriction endonuclease subunit S n=1 Tax=Bifidobacterium canis TaxID=2610880 RepID=UPI0012D9A0AC|nr:restriction endonuclease subunit S [Bifidobacterium canis]